MAAPSVTAEATGLQIAVYGCARGNITVPAGFTAATERDASSTTWRDARKASVPAGSTGTATGTASISGAWAAINLHMPGASVVSTTNTATDLGGDVVLTPSWSTGDGLLAVCGWSTDEDGRIQPPQAAGDLGVGWSLIADTGASTGPRLVAWWCTPVGDPGAVSFAGARDSESDTFMAVYVTSGQSDWWPRFCGEVAEFPQRWVKGAQDVWVPVRASGVSRRVDRGRAAWPALNAFFVNRASLMAYWPLDDYGVPAFSSWVPGGQVARFARGVDGTSPAPVLEGYDGFAGSRAVATFNGAGAIGLVNVRSDTGGWAAGCLVHVPDDGWTDGANILTVEFTGGDVSAFVVEADTGAQLTRRTVFTDGTTAEASTEDFADVFPDGLPGARLLVAVTLQENGSDVDWSIVVVNLDNLETYGHVNDSVASKTLGVPYRVAVGVELAGGATLHTTDVAFGHVWVSDDPGEFLNTFGLDGGSWSIRGVTGWVGDTVPGRLFHAARDDARVPVAWRSGAVDTVLGVQPVDTPLGVMRTAELASSGGRLFDAAGFPGMVYRDRVSKESQPAKLTLSLAGGEVSAVEPVDDDLLLVNDVTVERDGGGTARATDEASIAAVGRYARRFTLNLRDQSAAGAHAAWLVALGTVDGLRWPELTVCWSRSSQVTAGGLLEVGDVVELTDVPDWAGGATTRLVVEGYRDVVDGAVWSTTYVLVPAAVWSVGRWGADDAAFDTWGDAADPTAYPPVYWGLGET
jgi:hypothetical protein